MFKIIENKYKYHFTVHLIAIYGANHIHIHYITGRSYMLELNNIQQYNMTHVRIFNNMIQFCVLAQNHKKNLLLNILHF